MSLVVFLAIVLELSLSLTLCFECWVISMGPNALKALLRTFGEVWDSLTFKSDGPESLGSIFLRRTWGA